MTNNIDRPNDERSQESFEMVQGATEDALRAGRKYLSENPVAIILAALMVGAVLGFLLRPAPPKQPDPVQAVREWFENALEELIAKWPVSKKQLRSIQGDLTDRAQGLQKWLRFWCH
jgi:hypothetical protein